MAENLCKTCRFWDPSYFQYGQCRREFTAHSKIRSDGENTRIFTHITFGCVEYEQNPPEEKDTL